MAGLNTLEASNVVLPQDLVITAQPNIDTNYFTVTAKGLEVDSAYNFQFQWVYPDGTVGPWSPSVFLFTPTENVPGAPSATVPESAVGHIPVTLNAFPADALRVDVKISGAPFGDGTKIAYSFFGAGTITIAAPAGEYFVQLYTVTPTQINGTPTSAFTITVADNVPADEPSVTPSTPTVSSVLGAIQLAWDGKTSTGGAQPYGFNAAKVYVGTTAGFIPSASNQVDVLNFANGQNTLNIGVGTLVNGVALAYGIDYYVKIATTNGTDTSTAVSANGNPVRVGQVTSGDIVTISADKIQTGILTAGAKITAGAAGGKRVELSGTGDTPFAIYGTGGNKIFDYNAASDKLTIVGDGTFSGNLSIGTSPNIFKAEPATGIWLGGDGTYTNANFRVSTSGILRALSGSVGGWTITSNSIYSSSNLAVNRMALYPNTPQLSLIIPSSFKIELDPTNGLKFSKISDNSGNTVTSIPFQVTPNGNVTARNAIFTGGKITVDAGVGNVIQIGKDVNGTDVNGIYIDANNYWYASGLFSIGDAENSVVWDNTKLAITGEINATSGYIGTVTDGFTINDFGIFSNGTSSLISLDDGGTISIGNAYMSTDSNQFKIYDSDGYSILSVPTTGGRVLLGHLTEGQGRQVEVARSAQIAGDSNGVNARNSGGLRNMYTATVNNFTANQSMYLSDRSANGDVLLLWTP